MAVEAALLGFAADTLKKQIRKMREIADKEQEHIN